jgi:hypothetical protein
MPRRGSDSPGEGVMITPAPGRGLAGLTPAKAPWDRTVAPRPRGIGRPRHDRLGSNGRAKPPGNSTAAPSPRRGIALQLGRPAQLRPRRGLGRWALWRRGPTQGPAGNQTQRLGSNGHAKPPGDPTAAPSPRRGIALQLGRPAQLRPRPGLGRPDARQGPVGSDGRAKVPGHRTAAARPLGIQRPRPRLAPAVKLRRAPYLHGRPRGDLAGLWRGSDSPGEGIMITPPADGGFASALRLRRAPCLGGSPRGGLAGLRAGRHDNDGPAGALALPPPPADHARPIPRGFARPSDGPRLATPVRSPGPQRQPAAGASTGSVTSSWVRMS